MEVKSRLHSSPVSSSTVEAYLTAVESYADVINHHGDNVTAAPPTGCDASYEVPWDAADEAADCTPPGGGVMYHHNTTLDTGQTTFIRPAQDGDAPGFYDVIAAEPPSRCLDNGSDVTSPATATPQQLTQLSTVESVYSNDVSRQQFPVPVVTYDDVRLKRDDDAMTSSDSTAMMLLTEHLPSSEEVETYFSTVIDGGGPRSTETTTHHHHHPHHVYYQHHHPAAAQSQHQYNLSSSSCDVRPRQQFYHPSSLSSLSYNNYSSADVDLAVRETSAPPSLDVKFNYVQEVSSSSTAAARLSSSTSSLAGLLPVVMTTTSDTSSSSTLNYHPSTTATSHGHAGTCCLNAWTPLLNTVLRFTIVGVHL